MTQWVDVCGIEDLQPNSGICALISGKQVAIFYMPEDEAVYAINNYDPVGKANVLSRGMIGDLNGEPMVASPLYKQHFSLNTGVCLDDDSIKVDAYPIRISGDRVEVNVDGE
jgi:nitrite reductase (NADH) small subunit